MLMSKQPPNISAKDRYFFQNVFGVSAVEFLWGLGLPVVVESTFLQLFLTKMGASSLAIGLIPTLFFIGCSIFALVSSYLTAPLPSKKKAVILLHLVPAASLIFFGTALLMIESPRYLLHLFFFCYGIFSICIGMTLPVWLSYLVNIFSAQKSVAGLGYMSIFQNIGKLISSLALLKVVEAYAFSMHSAAVIFLVVGGLFAIGSFFFLFTHEVAASGYSSANSTNSLWNYVVENISHMLKNRNILLFLAADLDFFAVITAISFYANYATIFCRIDPAVAAGLFVACIYLGAIFSNIIFGSWGLLGLKSKFVASKLFSITALLLLTGDTTQGTFLLISFLLGMSRAIRMVVMPPAIKLLSGLSDAASYFALGAIVTLPVAVGYPLLTGSFLDYTMDWGGNAYRLVFGAGAVFIFMTLLFLLKIDFRKKSTPPF